MDLSKNVKEEIINKISNATVETIRLGLNSDTSRQRISQLKNKYPAMPNDILAEELIKRAVRKTTVEGVVNGGGITACEVAVAIPAPEPAHKVAAGTGVVGLVVGDATYTTAIQMQLILDIAELYECPFNKDDEDDVWIIFKAALGIKGVAKVGNYVKVIFFQTAKKQFRVFLRTGIRKSIQQHVIKIAGRQIGRLLGEKYVMRLIPIANMGIGGFFNNRITRAVGKWAKIRAKMRSLCYQEIDKIILEKFEYTIWVLPLIFYIGTCDNNLTDNFLILYAQASKKLDFSDEQVKSVDELINDDKLQYKLMEGLLQIENSLVKEVLFEIAIISAAVNINPTPIHHNCLTDIASYLGLEYRQQKLNEKIKYICK